MKNRASIFLLLLALVLLAIVNLFFLNRQQPQTMSGATRLLDPNQKVVAFSWMQTNEPTIQVECKAGLWWLTQPYSARANRQAVMELLDALTLSCVQKQDQMSDAELLRMGRTRADFELDPPVQSLSLVLQNQKEKNLSFGALTPDGSQCYVTESDWGFVSTVSTNLVNTLKQVVSELQDCRILDVPTEEVSTVEVHSPMSPSACLRHTGSGWLLDNEPAKEDEVRGFLQQLVAMKTVKYVGSASATELTPYGLDPDNAVSVVVRDIQGGQHRFFLGKADASDAQFVYVQLPDDNIIAEVRADIVSPLLGEKRALAEQRLFPVAPASILSVSMSVSGGTCFLSRPTDGAWQFLTPILAPVNGARMEKLLSALTALSVHDLVATNGVWVSISSNAVPIQVSAANLLGANARLEDFRSLSILSCDAASIRRLALSSGEKKTVVSASDTDFLSLFNPLRAVCIARLFVSPEDLQREGLENPKLTVSIDRIEEGAIRRNLYIGRQTPEGYMATLGSSDAIFVLPTETVQRFQSKLSAP